MNTTTAAATANVTVATIRTWCRRGVITATKQAGRWVIDAASLTWRITLNTLKARKEHTPQPDPTTARRLMGEINMNIAQAAHVGSITALRNILADVEARNIAAYVDPTGVYPTQQQWDNAAAYINAQIHNLCGEQRTNAAIYDYS